MGNSLASSSYVCEASKYGSEPALPIENNCTQYQHRSRDALTAELSKWIYSPLEPLPGDLSLEKLNHASNKDSVQWALVKSHDTVFVVFKGTNQVRDVLVNVAANPFNWTYYAGGRALSLGVHGGMWSALHTHEVMTTDQVLEELRNPAYAHLNIVLCGHSLGGGYAVLCGLELLHKGTTVDAVVAHGAPQVIKPAAEQQLWSDLSACTSVYVNSYDVVPRLPSCGTDWKDTITGVFNVGSSGVSLESLGVWSAFDSLKDFRHIGNLVFVADYSVLSEGPKCMLVSANGQNGEDGEGWKILRNPPKRPGYFIIRHHKCYPQVLNSMLSHDLEN